MRVLKSKSQCIAFANTHLLRPVTNFLLMLIKPLLILSPKWETEQCSFMITD